MKQKTIYVEKDLVCKKCGFEFREIYEVELCENCFTEEMQHTEYFREHSLRQTY